VRFGQSPSLAGSFGQIVCRPLLGCVAAFDAPARQSFVSELVGEANLSNAVALNSTSFNAARMIGPAIAGMLIAGVGTGQVFLINAASFVAALCALYLIRTERLYPCAKTRQTRGGVLEHDPALCGQLPDEHARQNKERERDATLDNDSIRSHPALAWHSFPPSPPCAAG